MSVTLQTADAVKPARPPGPSDVTTLTAAPRRAIASRYACLLTATANPGSAPWHHYGAAASSGKAAKEKGAARTAPCLGLEAC